MFCLLYGYYSWRDIEDNSKAWSYDNRLRDGTIAVNDLHNIGRQEMNSGALKQLHLQNLLLSQEKELDQRDEEIANHVDGGSHTNAYTS